MSDLQKLLSLLFLKSAPQDLTCSSQRTVQMAIVYFFSGYIVLQTTLRPDDMFMGLILGFFVQFAFVYIVLQAMGLQPRFLQTFLAILGVGVLFNLISWPIFSIMSDELNDNTVKSSMPLIFLMIISWEVLVKAYIFKHALEMKMLSALALSFSLFFISVALSQLLFSAEAAG
ncbi:MAG: hypothetical protein COB77_00710 [Gammaproteobacteria bacterium]|nr:MAG: hypothetical protein COB77_00710 [Gammaproteobacteria bacterium]